MRALGLIGGVSWESTAIYYRLLNTMTRERLGGLHSARLILWSVDFADIAARQSAGEWDSLTASMVDAARRLEAAGAEAVVICANTMHKMADEVAAAVGVPLLHVADATAQAVRAAGSARPILLATRYTMEQAFYRDRLEANGVTAVIPDQAGRDRVHAIIYDELCQGIVWPESKTVLLDEIARLRGQGGDGVILGCTELGMILSAGDLDIPVFDTTVLHARRAVDFALG
ncbi:aspartate/glutamate racemase [Caulobacter sp. CCUG 60055]|uniref:aspartate/glutamate racemase family protein n=1 Tax=Caulobacter sp. CCUG 60055 TaxID=2100090 RepID=UPI001FA78568|nr:aspartate/glutamate racemase family protein [Caulobacter sp. CCUG 60055]MCI3180732.1 aspartate/glutamate racemase [Caulobacter sp. CCUG 60055]